MTLKPRTWAALAVTTVLVLVTLPVAPETAGGVLGFGCLVAYTLQTHTPKKES